MSYLIYNYLMYLMEEKKIYEIPEKAYVFSNAWNISIDLLW